MTDHIVDINKKVQSSDAAEAIFFAADGMQPRQYRGRALAAALRALAEQVVPLLKTPWGSTLVPLLTARECRDQILAIATELEGQ
jgi:hypothetical protein